MAESSNSALLPQIDVMPQRGGKLKIIFGLFYLLSFIFCKNQEGSWERPFRSLIKADQPHQSLLVKT